MATMKTLVTKSAPQDKGLLLLLLLLLFLPSASSNPNTGEDTIEVITSSSPCSATCGPGLKSQTLCVVKDSEKAKAMKDDDDKGGTGVEVKENCRQRQVKCLLMMECGLKTFTVVSGARLEFDCLGEIMALMSKYSSWRVSWRYARGIISADNSLFARWKAPKVDRVILPHIEEEQAGTYRCDVLDVNNRMVKRAYWGVRVLPAGFLAMQYNSSLSEWRWTGRQQQDQTQDTHPALHGFPWTTLLFMGLCGFGLAVAAAVAIMLSLYCAVRMRVRRKRIESQG